MPVFNYPATALNELSARLAAAEAAIAELSQAIADNVDPMVGATGVADGISGLVPVPLAGQQESLLKGDATWLPTSAIGRSLLNAATAEAAASSLNLGTVFQPLNAGLTEIATTSTEWGRDFLIMPDAPTARDYLEINLLELQPADDELFALAGLSTNGLIERTGAGTVGTVTVTDYAKTLLNDANAATARATLELGTAAVAASTDFVQTTGTQTVDGVKTFNLAPIFSAGIELGIASSGNPVQLDFRVSSNDYGVRLYAQGGSATNGTADLLFYGNQFNITSTVASTSSTTGALVVGGGVGVAGALNVGGAASFGGFTTLGDNVATKKKRLTGSVSTLPTVNTFISHGLNAAKIVAWSCIVRQVGNNNNGFAPGYYDSAANYTFRCNNTDILIVLNASATTISGGVYDIILEYIA